MELQPGDIMFTRGTSLVSKLVRIFEKKGDEDFVLVNHTGVVVDSPDVIVEALTTVKKHTVEDQYGGSSDKVEFYRPVGLTAGQIDAIVAKANGYVGYEYGYFKLIAHLLDWCIGGRYVFRRIASMDRYPICSWVVAAAYDAAGVSFGVPIAEADPDDIWEYCSKNPDKFTLVQELENVK